MFLPSSCIKIAQTLQERFTDEAEYNKSKGVFIVTPKTMAQVLVDCCLCFLLVLQAFLQMKKTR